MDTADEEAHELRSRQSRVSSKRAVSLKRTLDERSTKTKSTTFTDFILNKARQNEKLVSLNFDLILVIL